MYSTIKSTTFELRVPTPSQLCLRPLTPTSHINQRPTDSTIFIVPTAFTITLQLCTGNSSKGLQYLYTLPKHLLKYYKKYCKTKNKYVLGVRITNSIYNQNRSSMSVYEFIFLVKTVWQLQFIVCTVICVIV